ncbi:hypothetical protein COT30_04095 [Candidatus Micrarchaeota archaeon CG08_land_8_20_14_0_20_49_17]|nr:MAG: hypothetical protein COT30_04095 [Candidatus Micrarchaeota archaeon CG08_land_8_20_14_0_20_49_17]
MKLAEYPALRAGMNAKRQLHENSRTTALEIFALWRKLDFRMSLHILHIVQGLSHQRERLFGKSYLCLRALALGVFMFSELMAGLI